MSNPPKELSIVSFNVLGVPFVTTHKIKAYLRISSQLVSRFRLLAKTLEKLQPDVIALQELHIYPLLYFLKRGLPSYPFVAYEPHKFGPRGGLVVFSRYPLEKAKYTDFHKHGSLRNKTFVAKIIQNGILRTKIKNSSFTILNTYITSGADQNWSETSKFHNLKFLQLQQLSLATELEKKMGNDVVIAGDFNIHKNSTLYKEFLKLTKVVDLFADSTEPTIHKRFLPDEAMLPRLDYIFTNLTGFDIKTISTKHLFDTPMQLTEKTKGYISDHIGLFAQVLLSPKKEVKAKVVSPIQ